MNIVPCPSWTPEASLAEIKRLTAKGILGFYSQVEATELIAFPPEALQPLNLLTMLVAEEHPNPQTTEKHFLNSSRIQIPGLKNWNFGICRYTVPLNQLIPVFERLVTSKIWNAAGNELNHNAIAARPPQFVPPDSIQKVPWNSALKNNFWNGSHVIEWADVQKTDLEFLLSAPHLLQALSEKIQHHIPIRLASLSDRLGNIILQLPVTVLMARFNGRHDGSMLVETGWHPQAQPRPLRATVELQFDKSITGYSSLPVTTEQTLLPLPPGPGVHRGVIWDDANGLMLAATGESAFIQTIAMDLRPLAPEPRVFMIPDANGTLQSQRISVHSSLKSLIEAPGKDGNEEWTQHRKYRDETTQLIRQRHFVQYRPQPGKKDIEHENALKDIRHLIATFGHEGAWLWDPYLSAQDILKTLFFSPHSGSDLRGLTALREAVTHGLQTSSNFIQKQQDTFNNAQSNFYGMRLEYRAKSGHTGWDFHDRFLILPQKDKAALAWSLGTSVNSLGKAHHILQRVDDGQQVMDAFDELWSQLDAPEQLIWKMPK